MDSLFLCSLPHFNREQRRQNSGGKPRNYKRAVLARASLWKAGKQCPRGPRITGSPSEEIPGRAILKKRSQNRWPRIVLFCAGSEEPLPVAPNVSMEDFLSAIP